MLFEKHIKGTKGIIPNVQMSNCYAFGKWVTTVNTDRSRDRQPGEKVEPSGDHRVVSILKT